MPTFIALYRGINVSGKNLVKMTDLRALHGSLGHASIETYLQSGNVVFSATGSPRAISKDISAAFTKTFGFAPAILVCTAAQWARFVAENPFRKFSDADPTKVHAAICGGEPCAQRLEELLKKVGKREQFVIKAGVIYLHAPDGFGTSKFPAAMERAAGVPITFRNWRTMQSLHGIANRPTKSAP
jgi:uncharacterized protein (DUF1697 family)